MSIAVQSASLTSRSAIVEKDIGEFWGGMEDLGKVARVGREEAGEDREM